MEFATDNITITIASNYWPHLIVGFALLVAAAYCRGWWIDGWGTWTNIFGQIDPSLEAHPSPIDQTAGGCGGLIAAAVSAPLTILFSVLAIDQLVFMGWLWEQIIMWVTS